jgi:hypothetical protein
MTPARLLTADEMLADQAVQQEMEAAWRDSRTDDAINRHEEGGWIYQDAVTGRISVRRAPAGTLRQIDLANPPAVTRSFVIGTYHTHPNPTAEGWDPEPSRIDQRNSSYSGVPWLVRADDGYHKCGPDRRRGGLMGYPGFPQ